MVLDSASPLLVPRKPATALSIIYDEILVRSSSEDADRRYLQLLTVTGHAAIVRRICGDNDRLLGFVLVTSGALGKRGGSSREAQFRMRIGRKVFC